MSTKSIAQIRGGRCFRGGITFAPLVDGVATDQGEEVHLLLGSMPMNIPRAASGDVPVSIVVFGESSAKLSVGVKFILIKRAESCLWVAFL